MTKKRFIEIPSIKTIQDSETGIAYTFCTVDDDFLKLVNNLANENKRLQKKLKIYRRIASCDNCYYHNYDWYDDGDEFEICEKGNDVDNRICKDWEEFF